MNQCNELTHAHTTVLGPDIGISDSSPHFLWVKKGKQTVKMAGLS
jgi:hypothetical protein